MINCKFLSLNDFRLTGLVDNERRVVGSETKIDTEAKQKGAQKHWGWGGGGKLIDVDSIQLASLLDPMNVKDQERRHTTCLATG